MDIDVLQASKLLDKLTTCLESLTLCHEPIAKSGEGKDDIIDSRLFLQALNLFADLADGIRSSKGIPSLNKVVELLEELIVDGFR